MFEVEKGGVQIIFVSQSGGRPNGHMKMSSAPSFGAPGGHIFDVVAPGLKTEKTLIYSQACTACSIGTTHAFVDLQVSN
jgi:hypothetical protein